MELREVAPGIYSILKIDLPEGVYFIRDTEDDMGGITLLHICRKEEGHLVNNDALPEPAYLVTTGKIYWDYLEGTYRCDRCAMEWNSEEGLGYIWEDGIGTGYEGAA